MSLPFTKSDIALKLPQLIDTELPEPNIIQQPLESAGCSFTLMTGRKTNYPDAVTFWISAMAFLVNDESWLEQNKEEYLAYRYDSIVNVICEPIPMSRFIEIIRLADEDPDFRFTYKPIQQMLMKRERNDIIVLFETKSEYGIFNWETET